ncbi:MAG: tetratricopeptide repeat protein [Sphingobacteriaceae bacterium]|nr:tetratricopeptide repeat protein [Cytophagaceae bacterium]
MKSSLKWLLLLGLGWGLAGPVAWAQKGKRKAEPVPPEQAMEAERAFTEGMKFYVMEDYSHALTLLEKALETHPNNAGVHFALAQAQQKLNNADKALAYAEKAYLLDDSNKYYAELLAEFYQKKHRFAEAGKLYQLLSLKQPDNADYALELAAVFLQQDKFDDALKTYDRLEKTLGVNEEITRQKQLIFLKQNKVGDAVREGEKLIDSDPSEVDYLVDLAELLMTHNRNEQAIPWLEKILAVRPDNAQAHIMLADLYRRKGDLEKCNRELELAFNDPNLDGLTKARVLTSYVAMLTDDKAKENALRFAQSLVRSNPEQPQAYVLYADLLLQKGDTLTARDLYIRAARLDKSMKEVWDRVLFLDGVLAQMDSLVAHADEALEVFPNQANYWYSSGSAQLLKRQYARAIEALEEAQRLGGEGDLSAAIEAQLGDAYNGTGQHEKSDEAYEAALKRDPNNDYVLNNYSYFLSLRNDNLARARELAAKLVERNPTKGTYLDTYGWVLFRSGDFAKARTVLEKAVQNNDGKSATIVEHYGDVLFQLGEKEKALDQWRKAKAMGQSTTQLDRKISTGTL